MKEKKGMKPKLIKIKKTDKPVNGAVIKKEEKPVEKAILPKIIHSNE